MTRNDRLYARTKSADDTRALAGEVASIIKSGDIVLLAGDLGAGKTAFTQGLARGLGVKEQVTSPTFTLLRPYEGERLRLLHADVYRLDHLREVVDLGIVEQLDDRASAACVEWGDLAEPVLPADFLEIRIEYTEADDERVLRFRVVGPTWAARRTALERAIGQWLVDGTKLNGGNAS
jgi:tRNA threonylcarbamoyladenosine biosynthesis protein TsaE